MSNPFASGAWCLLGLGVAETDPRGRIVRVNRAFEAILDRPAADLMGTAYASLASAPDREALTVQVEALRRGESPSFTLVHRFAPAIAAAAAPHVETWAAAERDHGDPCGDGAAASMIFVVRALAEREVRRESGARIAAQEAERRRIARELHDEIGQALNALQISLVLARGARGEVPGAPAEPERMVLDILKRMREVTLELRPSALDDLGLVPALRAHIDRFTAQTRIPVEFEDQGRDERYHPELEITAYRIVQEALANVARHAGPGAGATLVVFTADRFLHIEVSDTGRGFDPASPLVSGATGVAGMHERVALVGGTLTIVTVPGGGTRVLARLPIDLPAGTSEPA